MIAVPDLASFLLIDKSQSESTLQGQEEKRKRLRAELLRWHPDKFQSSFGRNLKPEDAEQILAKVNEISQAINMAAK